MDKKAALAPYAPSPQGNPLVPPNFLIPPVSQAEFFPSMPSEAFQAFTTYWYAQAQAQVEVSSYDPL